MRQFKTLAHFGSRSREFFLAQREFRLHIVHSEFSNILVAYSVSNIIANIILEAVDSYIKARERRDGLWPSGERVVVFTASSPQIFATIRPLAVSIASQPAYPPGYCSAQRVQFP